MSQSQSPLDERSEAHNALNSAVANYGPRVLQNPQMLGNVVTDLLPDSPRERNLLVAAAEAGVAAELNQHVQEQHVDAGTAVQLVAHGLAERKSIDTAASMWVTAEYARALGYWVHPSIPVSTPEEPGYSISSPHSAGGHEGIPASSWPGPAAPGSPVPGGLPAGPPPGGGRKKISGGIIAVGAAALVLITCLGIAATTKMFPFAAAHPVATSSPKPTSGAHPTPGHPTPTAPSTPTLAPGVANLAQLLPGDLDQPAVECPAQKPPYPWKLPGLVEAMQCTDPNLPGGTVWAYQMDNSADYQAAWQNFLSWWGLDLSNAQPTCPPSGAGGEGTVGWHNGYFPSTANQSLVCGWVGSNGDTPAYAWAIPTEDAFIYAVGAEGSSFSALDNWWVNDATQAASPAPASP
jgi:hypothetical protein